jgi:alpha-beta hydrolase superfamily lysophospholipase
MFKLVTSFCLVILLVLPGVALAQDGGDPPEPPPAESWPLAVQVEAADSLLLAGDLYLIDPARPTILLIHEMYTDRTSWGMLIDPLIWAGYNVLTIDQRGHGATGGSVNWWQSADQDIPLWITWLRDVIGVRPDAISCIGSSMGASIALEGCSLDPATRTVIALSPGWRYHGVNVNASFYEKFGARPVLLVYAKNDFWPAYGIPLMLDIATNPVTVHEFPGSAHGMLLFEAYHDELIALIIEWLNTYGAL